MLLSAGVMHLAELPTSCAIGVDCEDTGTGPDLGWLTIPAVVLVVLVVAVIVHVARRGGRGL